MEFIDPINRGHARDLKKAIKTAMKKDKTFTVNKEINVDKQTILHYCVLQGHLCLVTLLQKLKLKPNYDLQDTHGMTALHYACFSGNLEIIDELLYNTNVSLVSKTNTSAFHLFVNKPTQFSAPTKFDRLYQTFITRGMDVNLKNAAGDTPLHFAVQKGNEKITMMLLSSGANPSIQNQFVIYYYYYYYYLLYDDNEVL
jgi:ankyrin repeat protein